MTRSNRLCALAGALLVPMMLGAVPGVAGPEGDSAPDGWIKAGDAPDKYEVGVDRATSHGGHACGYVRSLVSVTGGFGTLMQESSAATYEGKRVRMSAWAMSAEVGGWAGMWMRVDGQGPHDLLAFDNMHSRPIKGSTPWTRYEIVLDVPKGARQLAYGILLNGAGETWIDDIRFEIVDRSVPVTGGDLGRQIGQRAPSNLDFEH